MRARDSCLQPKILPPSSACRLSQQDHTPSVVQCQSHNDMAIGGSCVGMLPSLWGGNFVGRARRERASVLSARPSLSCGATLSFFAARTPCPSCVCRWRCASVMLYHDAVAGVRRQGPRARCDCNRSLQCCEIRRPHSAAAVLPVSLWRVGGAMVPIVILSPCKCCCVS